jgi:hypothetical protein
MALSRVRVVYRGTFSLQPSAEPESRSSFRVAEARSGQAEQSSNTDSVNWNKVEQGSGPRWNQKGPPAMNQKGRQCRPMEPEMAGLSVRAWIAPPQPWGVRLVTESENAAD